MASCKAGLLFPSLKGLRGIQLGNVWSRDSILALLLIHHNQGILNSSMCKTPNTHHRIQKMGEKSLTTQAT